MKILRYFLSATLSLLISTNVGALDAKDKLTDKIRYMTYYDLNQNGYRCATGQIWITADAQ